MPRLPKSKTPLRLLREELGYSQKQFAELLEKSIGLKPTTYKAHELGRRLVPATLATRLMILTAVDPESIMAKTGKPRLNGKPYSRDGHDAFVQRERNYTAASITEILRRVIDRYLTVLLSAQSVGKFTQALYMFERGAEEAVTSLGLAATFGRMSPEGSFVPWRGAKVGTAGSPSRQPFEPLVPLGDDFERGVQNVLAAGREQRPRSSRNVRR